MRTSFFVIFSLLILEACSSNKIKIHENLDELDAFMKIGNVYIGEQFNETFSFEGRSGNYVYLVGVSEYSLVAAERDAREKIMDYIGNDSTLMTRDASNRKQNRKISSVTYSKSSLHNFSFSNLEKKSKCILMDKPRLDLKTERVTECRVMYRIPISLIEGDNASEDSK